MLELLRNKKELTEMLYDICDVNIFTELRDWDDEKGQVSGQSFARDGAGSDYIMFDDGSVGFYSSEGELGRIADTLQEFFMFMINCPFWRDYLRKDAYQDLETLRALVIHNSKEHCEMAQEEMDIDLRAIQQTLAQQLEIPLVSDVAQDVLLRFYKSAMREPKVQVAFRENDGSLTMITGTLFDSF